MNEIDKILSLIGRIEYKNNILTEGVETKNMKLAKDYLYRRMGYDQDQALKTIGKIKNDIPNSRVGKCKFMLAIVRMFFDKEITSQDIISNLNETLGFIAERKYIDNFDNNLNGLHCNELINQFKNEIEQHLTNKKKELSNDGFIRNSDYTIVKINDFNIANEYSRYTSWCVTHNKGSFDTYTNVGINQFYFCLRNGFENEEEVIGENCPLDSYGLSMIAVSIRPNGSINTCTCRWNHDNGGNDNIMNDKQLSELLGCNMYDVLLPKKISEEDIIEAIENGNNILLLQSIAFGDFVVPKGTRYIGYEAFYGCSGLTSVVIPDGVTSIGTSAFGNCISLTSVTIPSSVTSIDEGAFSGCSGLTSVSIPSSVTRIGSSAFDGCSCLTSVVIPYNVTNIGNWAFYDCHGLTSVTIPSSVTFIGYNVFYRCSKLTVYVQNKQTAELVRQADFDGNIQLIPNNSGISEGRISRIFDNTIKKYLLF